MATFDLTILNSVTVTVIKDGVTTYKPRDMVPIINGNDITFQHPSNINYDFTVSTTDTITVATSTPVTGTAEQIADALVEAIFFQATSSGGPALDADNEWSGWNTFTQGAEVFGPFASFSVSNTDPTGTSDLSVNDDTVNGLKVKVYGSGTGDADSIKVFVDGTNTGEFRNDSCKPVLHRYIPTADTASTAYTFNNNRATNTGAIAAFQFNSASILIIGQTISNYADDTAAAAGGVPVNGLYRTGSALKIRVA